GTDQSIYDESDRLALDGSTGNGVAVHSLSQFTGSAGMADQFSYTGHSHVVATGGPLGHDTGSSDFTFTSSETDTSDAGQDQQLTAAGTTDDGLTISAATGQHWHDAGTASASVSASGWSEYIDGWSRGGSHLDVSQSGTDQFDAHADGNLSQSATIDGLTTILSGQTAANESDQSQSSYSLDADATYSGDVIAEQTQSVASSRQETDTWD